jgi:mono/diheme cytochrome c family protein
MSSQIRISVILLVGALALGSSCNPNPQITELTPVPSLAPGITPSLESDLRPGLTPETVFVSSQNGAALGAPLYMIHCSVCHGVQGEGVDGPSLRNSQFVQTASDQAVGETIANGRPGTEMPAWLRENGGPLDNDEVAYVVSYIHTLQGLEALPTATPMNEEGEEEEAGPSPPTGGPTPEPARPSLPGDTGRAVELTGDPGEGEASFGVHCATCHGPEGRTEVGLPNPGSDDGQVPELNPIDPTISNPDDQFFAENLDLFLEHGSVPEGPAPRIMMPAFGDSGMLSPQQIADLIAYLLYLNTNP